MPTEIQYQNCELQCGQHRIMRWLPVSEHLKPGDRHMLVGEVGEWTVNTVYYAEVPESKLLPEYKIGEIER